jgi:hypothetical protein
MRVRAAALESTAERDGRVCHPGVASSVCKRLKNKEIAKLDDPSVRKRLVGKDLAPLRRSCPLKLHRLFPYPAQDSRVRSAELCGPLPPLPFKSPR